MGLKISKKYPNRGVCALLLSKNFENVSWTPESKKKLIRVTPRKNEQN